jgi:hypothetical protein
MENVSKFEMIGEDVDVPITSEDVQPAEVTTIPSQ